MTAPDRDPIEALVGECPYRAYPEPRLWPVRMWKEDARFQRREIEQYRRDGWQSCLGRLDAAVARASWRGRLALWLLGVRP